VNALFVTSYSLIVQGKSFHEIVPILKQMPSIVASAFMVWAPANTIRCGENFGFFLKITDTHSGNMEKNFILFVSNTSGDSLFWIPPKYRVYWGLLIGYFFGCYMSIRASRGRNSKK
jgi:hypothetical protein